MMLKNLSRLIFPPLAIALMTLLVNNALAQSTHVAEPLASAVTITVDSTDDDLTDNGNCTLREAIQAANTGAAVDMCPAGGVTTTIMLPAGTYTLTIPGNFENDNQTGDLDILSTVVIIGDGRDTTIINGNDLDRVFDVRDAGHATISHLTITGGDNSGSSGGGARAVDGGTIHLSHVHVTGNTAEGSGGGLAVLDGDTLTIEYSQITQNVAAAFGGGISNRNGTVAISHSSIVGNESWDSGGGIANQAVESDANLIITDSEVLNNVAGNNGGGIGNALDTGRTATLLVERVTISGNSAAVGDNGLSGLGGGVTNNVFSGAASGAGIVTIRDSVISDNQATNGGGIGNTPATATGPVTMQLTVENSAITGNTASGNGFQTGNGGGIASLDGMLTVVNSTISGNGAGGTAGAPSVSGLGGGLLIGSQALPNNATLIANTIANNTAVTGVSGIAHASLGGPTTTRFKNTIIAGNVGLNCLNQGGTLTSLGYNLEATDSCGFDQASDLVDTDPMLEGLTADGATSVHPLMVDSPAIDAGSCTDANDDPLTNDQRGVSRPQGAGCDMGAYERVVTYTVTATVGAGDGTITPTSQNVDQGNDATFTVTPDPGWSVTTVVGDTCTPVNTSGSIWVASNVTAACAVTANFAQDTFDVNATVAVGQGTITPPTQNMAFDGTASFMVTPNTGWSVDSVLGDTCSPALVSGNDWQASNIQQDCAVQASFVINTYIVSAAVSSGNGTITPLSQSVDHGDDATFTITPDPGWSVTAVTGDTCAPANSSGTTWVASNISEACAVIAAFQINVYTIGGTVTGLTAGSLALQNNDGDDLTINANGNFTFATPLADLSPYAVTVSSQPPGQSCMVDNAIGMLSGADVDDVLVTCSGIELGLNLSDIQFPNLLQGSTAAQALTLSNIGQADLIIDAFFEPGQPFGFDAQDCVPLPLTLTPGESCTAMVSFDATTLGDFADELLIVSNGLGSPDRVGLTGSAVPPATAVPTLGLPAALLMILSMMLIVSWRGQIAQRIGQPLR